MKDRSSFEKNQRHAERDALAAEMSKNTVPHHFRSFEEKGTGDRAIDASADSHIKELKIRVASAAYGSLRALGVPVHNTRAGDVNVVEQDEVMGRVSVKKASFDVKFDIPFSSPEGRGVRTASIPVSYEAGDILVGKEISYNNVRYSATSKSLNEIAAIKEAPRAESAHTVVAVLTDKGHEILGATKSAPAICAALKAAGYRVAFRNPQDALNITVVEPFYEVLCGGDVADAKKIASRWLSQVSAAGNAAQKAADAAAAAIANGYKHKPSVQSIPAWLNDPDDPRHDPIQQAKDLAMEAAHTKDVHRLTQLAVDENPNVRLHATYNQLFDPGMAKRRGRVNQRKAQTDPKAPAAPEAASGVDPLVAPASTTPVPSSDELENFRQEVAQLEGSKSELDAAVAAYAEGLIKKAGFENEGAMHQRLQQLREQVSTAADSLKAPLVQLRDGNLLAKVTSTKINDVAWKSYLEALSTRAKRLVNYLTRWSSLFRKMTVSHSWKEIAPEDVEDVFKKQTKQQGKIDKFQAEQSGLATKAPKYLLNEGTGGTIVKSAQAVGQEDSGDHPGAALLETAGQTISETADTNAQLIAELQKKLESQAKVQEANEQYPLPSPVAPAQKAASKRAKAPLMNLSMNRKLSEAEQLAVQGFQFSAAGEGKHWAFYRTSSKKGETQVHGVLGRYVAMGFTEEEAFGELKRKAQLEDASYLQVFAVGTKEANAAIDPADLKIVKGGYIVGEADELVALDPKEIQAATKANVYFYLGGRLYDEVMEVVQAGHNHYVDYEQNIDLLS